MSKGFFRLFFVLGKDSSFVVVSKGEVRLSCCVAAVWSRILLRPSIVHVVLNREKRFENVGKETTVNLGNTAPSPLAAVATSSCVVSSVVFREGAAGDGFYALGGLLCAGGASLRGRRRG